MISYISECISEEECTGITPIHTEVVKCRHVCLHTATLCNHYQQHSTTDILTPKWQTLLVSSQPKYVSVPRWRFLPHSITLTIRSWYSWQDIHSVMAMQIKIVSWNWPHKAPLLVQEYQYNYIKEKKTIRRHLKNTVSSEATVYIFSGNIGSSWTAWAAMCPCY